MSKGFSRYSVDEEWHVPHFEKMLYDQGQLLQSYTDAFLTTKDPLFAEIIDDIATYVSRDLRHKVSLALVTRVIALLSEAYTFKV